MADFPTVFPFADMSVLMDFFSSNRAKHTNREYAATAYDLLGYGLGQVFKADPVPTPQSASIPAVSARAEINSDEKKLACLKKLHDSFVPASTDPDEDEDEDGDEETSKHELKAGVSINWAQIISIMITILQQVGPLL